MTTFGPGISDSSALWSRPWPRRRAAALKRLHGTIWEHSEIAVFGYVTLVRLGGFLARIGVTANALTYASAFLAGLSCAAAASGWFVPAAVAALLGGLCDALDGVVARTMGSTSRYGALLDSTVDRISDTLPLLGIVIFHARFPLLALLPGIALIAAVVIPYARARAEALGAQLPSLFMRRPERVLMLVVALLLGGVHIAPGMPAPWLLGTTGLLALLNVTGAVVVLRAARRALESGVGAARRS